MKANSTPQRPTPSADPKIVAKVRRDNLRYDSSGLLLDGMTPNNPRPVESTGHTFRLLEFGRTWV